MADSAVGTGRKASGASTGWPIWARRLATAGLLFHMAAVVAGALGVHPSSVLRWERRERLPGPVHIRRLAAALELTPEAPEFRLAVRLRAVTAGRFELPGAQVEDMYRPALFARQNGGRVAVLPVD